jgi:hypothetical protein
MAVIFVYLLLNITLLPSGDESIEILQDKNVMVQYTQSDSVYAHEIAKITVNTMREISRDFQTDNTNMDSIFIIIAPSRKKFLEYAQGELPNWTQAFAIPTERLIVLKSPRWDRQNRGYVQTLVHEILHIKLYQIVGNRPIPRWLDEGLAIFYSYERRWDTMSALSKAAATNSLIPLEKIDDVLTFHRIKAELAYQESYSAVKYLLQVYDIEAIRIILKGIKNNQNLNHSFRLATGSSFDAFEQEWIKFVKKSYKWYWLAEIDTYIWILALLLFFIAVIIIRIRNYRKVAKWKQEEEEEETENNIEEF